MAYIAEYNLSRCCSAGKIHQLERILHLVTVIPFVAIVLLVTVVIFLVCNSNVTVITTGYIITHITRLKSIYTKTRQETTQVRNCRKGRKERYVFPHLTLG